MRITEEQLYKMICESINDVLMEDGEEVNSAVGPWRKRLFGLKNNTVDLAKRIGPGIASIGATAAGGVHKALGKAAGTTAELGVETWQSAQDAVFGDTSTDSIMQKYGQYRTTPEEVGNAVQQAVEDGGLVIDTGAIVIGSLLALAVAKAIASWYNAKKQRVPLTYATGKEAIRIAVTERSKTQNLCVQVSEKLNNAILNYNAKMQKQNGQPISENELFRMAMANVNVQGSVPVTPQVLKIDFTNKYAQIPGVTLSEADNTNNVNISANNNQNTDQEKNALIAAMGEFVKIVTVWLDWTDYINDCVTTFKSTGLTFKNAIDFKFPFILVHWGKKIGGSVLKFAGEKLLNKAQGTEQETKKYESHKTKQYKVNVLQTDFKLTTADTKTYILLQPLGVHTTETFTLALPNTGQQQLTPNATYKLNYSPSYIARAIYRPVNNGGREKVYILQYIDDTDLSK
jgi:hypothetical protein